MNDPRPRLSLLINLEPAPKQRIKCRCKPRGGPRCQACGRPARPSVPQIYQPGTPGERWMDHAAMAIRSVWQGRPPMNGPLRLTARFVHGRPGRRPPVSNKEWKAGGHFMADPEKWTAGGRILRPAKPDLDRLENNLFDALTEAGVWWDDSQVAITNVSKWYAAVDEKPHVFVRVEEA